MTTPEGGSRRSSSRLGDNAAQCASPDLEAELLQADRDFEDGDYIELTVEELERCNETGEWPKWPDGSSL
jgi:hypothetical protein